MFILCHCAKPWGLIDKYKIQYVPSRSSQSPCGEERRQDDKGSQATTVGAQIVTPNQCQGCGGEDVM